MRVKRTSKFTAFTLPPLALLPIVIPGAMCSPGKQHPCDIKVNFRTVPYVPTVGSIIRLSGHNVIASQGSKPYICPLVF